MKEREKKRYFLTNTKIKSQTTQQQNNQIIQTKSPNNNQIIEINPNDSNLDSSSHSICSKTKELIKSQDIVDTG